MFLFCQIHMLCLNLVLISIFNLCSKTSHKRWQFGISSSNMAIWTIPQKTGFIPGQLTTSRALNKSWTQISVRSKIGMTVWLNKTGRNNIFFLVIRPSNSGSNTGPPQDWMDEVASFCRFVLGDFGWWIVSSHPQFKISPLTSASRERSRSRFQTFGKSYTFCQRNPEVKKTCGSFHVDLEGHLGRGLKPQIFKRSW